MLEATSRGAGKAPSIKLLHGHASTKAFRALPAHRRDSHDLVVPATAWNLLCARDPEHRGAGEAVMRQIAQCRVGLCQRVAGGLDADPDVVGDGEELLAIASGVGGDAAQLSLLEEMVGVAERRDVAEVDSGDGEGAAPVEGGQGSGNDVAGGRKDDG